LTVYLYIDDVLTTQMKIKTSITIDEKLWTKFRVFVIENTGSSRKISETLEQAIIRLMGESKEETE